MASHDPHERRLISQRAALTRWARESGRANALRAQDGFLRKFYDATEPTLPEAERWRRAECARRAHMIDLSRRARAARKGGAA